MKADVYRSVGNLQLDYVMPFLPALHANLNLGYDVSHSIQHNLMTPDSPLTYKENKKTGLGQDERLRQLKRNLLLDFYLNYKQDFESRRCREDQARLQQRDLFHDGAAEHQPREFAAPVRLVLYRPFTVDFLFWACELYL